jgi:hypothetical protein
MTSTASDTPKVSTGFDINAEFRSVMHELGLSPEDTGGTITFVGEDRSSRACIGSARASVSRSWPRRRGLPISGASAPAAART